MDQLVVDIPTAAIEHFESAPERTDSRARGSGRRLPTVSKFQAFRRVRQPISMKL